MAFFAAVVVTITTSVAVPTPVSTLGLVATPELEIVGLAVHFTSVPVALATWSVSLVAAA